jgi:hypothetical protein
VQVIEIMRDRIAERASGPHESVSLAVVLARTRVMKVLTVIGTLLHATFSRRLRD